MLKRVEKGSFSQIVDENCSDLKPNYQNGVYMPREQLSTKIAAHGETLLWSPESQLMDD